MSVGQNLDSFYLFVCNRHNLPIESGNVHEPACMDCSFDFGGDARNFKWVNYKTSVSPYHSQRVFIVHVD